MFVPNTSSKIEALLAGAVATNNLPFYASWADQTTTTFDLGRTTGSIAGVSAQTLVGSPAASTQRQLLYAAIYNADTADAAVTVRYFNGTSNFGLPTVTLKPGETLQYVYDVGWFVTDGSGAKKEGNSSIVLPTRRLYPMAQPAGNINSVNRTLGGNSPVAFHVGRAGAPYTSATVLYDVTVAGVGITWAEVAIATCPSGLYAAKNPLVIRGFADISAVANSLGVKKTTISGLTGILPGHELWIVFGNVSATTGISLAGMAADAQSVGVAIKNTARRPSTDVGKQYEWIVDTGIAAWCSAVFS